MAEQKKSAFAILNAIDCSKHVEQKNGLTYLSWAWAWKEVKERFPEASYTIYENASGMNYHTDGRTAWVKTGVTIAGLEHIEYLPVMDNRNRSIPADALTSFDVNKAIQRSLTKACARHGLGLYIYAGEDLPEAVKEEKAAADAAKAQAADARLAGLLGSIAACKLDADVIKIWNDNPDMQRDKKFYNAIGQRRADIAKGGAA